MVTEIRVCFQNISKNQLSSNVVTLRKSLHDTNGIYTWKICQCFFNLEKVIFGLENKEGIVFHFFREQIQAVIAVNKA